MRGIGKRVLQTCEAIESLGVTTCREIVKVTGIPSSNQGKYIYRAVEYGLVEVMPHQKRGNGQSPQRYRVNPNWREVLYKPPEKKSYQVIRKLPVSFVFNLGAQ